MKYENKLIKRIEERYGKSLLAFDGLIHQKRQNSVWYGGTIIEFRHGNHIIKLKALGDVYCHLKNDRKEYVKDKNNAGSFYQWAMSNGIRTDKQANKSVVFGNNNWYEVWIYDVKEKRYVNPEFDCIWEDDIEAFVETEADEILKGYLEEA